MSLNNLTLSDIDTSQLVFDGIINISFKNKKFNIQSLPLEIKKYCMIKFLLDKYLVDIDHGNDFKLSDFNLMTFKFDKENRKVIINNFIININEIVSDEIRNYCYDQICDMSNEKEICQYFIESIKTINGLSLNMNLYRKIKTLNHILYLNKYIFIRCGSGLSPDIVKELLSVYTQHPSLFLDLIKDIIPIPTKNRNILINIFINKEINIKNIDYDKLKEFAILSRSNEVYDLLTMYQSLDYLSNDIYFEKQKQKTN